MRCFRWLLLVVLVLACTDALAEIYRWRDAQGKLHFTDSLQQVPTEYRPGVRDTQGSYDNLNFVKGATQARQQLSETRLRNTGPSRRLSSLTTIVRGWLTGLSSRSPSTTGWPRRFSSIPVRRG